MFVQYSSGTTGEPRGCALSARGIAWQLSALGGALLIDPDRDVGVSWLPLSHDMGLFGGVLLAYWWGHSLVLGSPDRFLCRPHTWFDDCARYAPTLTVTPPFGLSLAARAADTRLPPPCPTMRCVEVGAESIDARVLRRAANSLGPDRLPWTALTPAYGLAEAVLAVSITPVGEGPTLLNRSRGPDELAGACTADTLVSSGRPLPKTEIIPSDGGLLVRSPSLARGYHLDPVQTESRFTADGFRTGDTGYLDDGQLYVTGRTDGMLTIGGRNLHAEDLERAFAMIPGVRAGRCVLVGVKDSERGTPRLAVVLERAASDRVGARIEREIAQIAQDLTGTSVAGFVWLAEGELPRTSSGKVQRFRCRDLARASFPNHIGSG